MKIHEIIDLRNKEGAYIGVEIEVEGENLPRVVDKIWKVVPDGSLRGGGLEYVYRQPIKAQRIGESLEELAKAFAEAEAQPVFSFRTSVHVHVNCLDLEYQQVLNCIYTYFLLENILVDFCGEGRKGNRFCLRLQDADGSLEYIERLFSSKGRVGIFQRIPRDMIRYASLNIEALPKFGTLEFRSMRGTLDEEVIIPWVETLVNIREYAKEFEDVRAIFNRLEEVGERQFFQEAIGKHHPLFDNGQIVRSISLGRSLSIDLPFIEQRDVVLADKNPRKLYRINGRLVRVSTLIDHFGENIPEEIMEQIIRQDMEDHLGIGEVRLDMVDDEEFEDEDDE